MAERWAVVNGNANATTTWDGGTLPGVGDDVYANGFNVAIVSSVTWASARTTAGATAVAGGAFTLNAAGVTLTANIFSGTSQCVSYSGGSPNVATIIGNVVAGDFRAVSNLSTGTLNIQGNVTAGATGAAHGALNNSTGTLNITGICTGGGGGNGAGANNAAGGTINITGDCIGGTANANRGATNASTGTVVITGNVFGAPGVGVGAGAVNLGTGTLTISGDATGQNGVGVSVTGNGVTSIGGTVSIGVSSVVRGLVSTNTTVPVTIGKLKYGANGASPYSGLVVFANLATATIEVRDTTLAPVLLS